MKSVPARRLLPAAGLVLALVLLFAVPPGLFRRPSLRIDEQQLEEPRWEFPEARTYEVEFVWQPTIWQRPQLEFWVDDCLRSIVINDVDLSALLGYCDFVGSRKLDLGPLLVDGRAHLRVQVENLGGPGGMTVHGVANEFLATWRYLVSFGLLLWWLHRPGEEPGAGEPDTGAWRRRTRGVGAALAAAAVVAGFFWLGSRSDGARDGSHSRSEGERAPPSIAEDKELNPRILVAGGEFLMGSPEGVAYEDERPVRRVRISSFRMQRYEVTNEEYLRFRPGHRFLPGQERYPAVNVTWEDARAYARWLGGSLPTEAQWEFAARGPRGRKYPWGDEPPDCSRANFNDCGWRLAPVGGRPAGATRGGIEDLAGNVWEWCTDWYADRYPSPGSPEAVTDPTGAPSGWERVMRGGSLIGGPGHLRGAYRGSYNPGFLGHDIGFRVVWPEERESP